MRYYLIAGERSGDLHGANLIRALKERDDQAEFRCWGGGYMEEAGAELVVHYRNLSFMGFIEVILYFNRILKYIRLCKKDILAYSPDVVILIDFGGFNLRMSKFLKKKRIRVFYYISPKIWAWNTGRAKTIKANIDRMFVILPFEKDFYRTFGYDVDYVGNPVVDAIRVHSPDPSFFMDTGLRKGERYIAFLPGSRNQELKSILPQMISLAKAFPEENFVLAAISTVPDHLYQPCLGVKNIHPVFDRTNDILAFAFAGVITSGTATLETAIWGIPQVVVYRSSSKISFFIARMVVKVKFISLVNLIANREVVRELIQKDLTLDNLGAALNRILYDQEARSRMLQDYQEIRDMLGEEPVSGKAAELMIGYLRE
ncbi:MAG: lipid-A-disaccharide synthase [Cyclobacteriaceae bacterium]|nr:lipid-A-disaccharide synthase [Cyclobacteriaceae bacterium]